MSETNGPTPAPPVAPPPTPTTVAGDVLLSPQTIIALIGMLIVAGTVIGVFLKGDPPTLQLVVGLVIGTYGGSVFSFYFGSSKGSQQKDATIAAQAGAPPPSAAPVVPPVVHPPA